MNSVKEAVTWSGPAIFGLFTVGGVESRLAAQEFAQAGMRPDEVHAYRMSAGPGGGRAEAAVWEYDLTFRDTDLVFAPYLRECLRRASAHAQGIAWLAFEGSFHFDHLFTDDIAGHVYGYCVIGGDPVVTWDHTVLAGDAWKQEIRTVRGVLDRTFPADGAR
ncbi:hypothetical protein [Streptomyces cinereospinus]|uniref:Uncharacterized protein n=1 Tax=Streptomyces cinereospinus TaxID=285561 RepID=A0ABV5MY83_9ACTN